MSKSLKHIALVVTSGTLLSKAGGLGRQLAIAAAFGVGAAYDAFNYASIIPGFLLVMLGGINGPFHSSMVTVLSRRPKTESAEILIILNTVIGTVLATTSIFLIFLADQIIHLLGPGLSPQLHHIAVMQLQIMSPMALLAGLIGLGFGSLNAANQFWIPSVSPLMSSLTIIVAIGVLWLRYGENLGSNQLALEGGIALAIAALLGAFLQWLLQLPALMRQGLTKVRFSWNITHPGVVEVWRIMWPASLSSGMLQINVFTDLFFASGIFGAAAGLSYATLLVQTPLGLISNALLVPLLPALSKLTDKKDRAKLIARVRQGLMLSTASMVALGALFIAISSSIVSLVYQRGAFDEQAATLVSGLLIAYGIGMPVYLGRDFLVRVFYALGDAQTPFRISALGIGLNVLLDWLLLGGPSPWGQQFPFNFGAIGLVLATAGVNFCTCLILLFKLSKNLNGLPLRSWSLDILKLIGSGILSGIFTWFLRVIIIWPNESYGLLVEVIISSCISLTVFGLIGSSMGIREVDDLIIIFKQRLKPH